MKREIFTREAPQAREAGEDKRRVIEGYAIVFGQESEELCDWTETYREIIEPTAITQEEIAQHDVIATMWHNREKVLARSKNGEGTLTLTVDARGVKATFEVPDTADGQNAYELVKRGDIQGMSFVYWTDERTGVEWKREGGRLIRRVKHIDHLADVTLATSPAYTQTSVKTKREEMPAQLRELLDRERNTEGELAYAAAVALRAHID